MTRKQIGVLGILVVGYGSFYLCRANLEAANPLLLAEGFTKTRLGLLSTVATLTYAIGKFVMGAAGDKLGGRRLVGLAVAGSVLFSLLFGVQRTFVGLVVIAAANRFFQSGGWSGVVHVVSRWFGRERYGLVMGVLAISYELGNFLALRFSAIVARSGWRALFVVNPLLFAVLGGGAVLLMRGAPPAASATPDESAAVATAAAATEAPEPLGRILAALAKSGSFWAAVVLSALLTFVRIAFLTWTSTYLFELSRAGGHSDASGAIEGSALFPAAGVLAVLTVGVVSDRLGPGRRAPVMAVALTIVVALVLVLGHTRMTNPTRASLLIAAIGLFLLGPYSLLAGAVALDVAGKRGTATATGIIDGAGYLCAAASGFGLGTVADRMGWSAAFDVVAAAAFVAAVVSAVWSVVVLRRRA
jgi:sugar phosphate permease